ncbi:cell division protein SepF [Bacteroidota bacterium]
MKNLFSKFTKKPDDSDENGEAEYVEIDTEEERDKTSKIIVRPFVMEDFSDIKEVLDILREGYTIALINIKPLKDKDLVELKRAINKLKKTCDAIDGDIAGFGDDYVVVTPSFAEIHRTKSTNNIEE